MGKDTGVTSWLKGTRKRLDRERERYEMHSEGSIIRRNFCFHGAPQPETSVCIFYMEKIYFVLVWRWGGGGVKGNFLRESFKGPKGKREMVMVFLHVLE